MINKNDILFSEIRPKNKRYAFVTFESDDYVVSTKFMEKAFEGIVKPIDDKIFNNSKTVNSLSETRDKLLPKLMSGEIRVK